MKTEKLLTYLESLKELNGVYVDPAFRDREEFAEKYLAVRKKENRFYSDKELKQLPYLENHIHLPEWKMRAKSFKRTINYFQRKPGYVFLDLGCGNGWYTDKLARIENSFVAGLDVNAEELDQAVRVFKKQNLAFIKGDVFKINLPTGVFDYIILNASVQYFSNLELLIRRLFELLNAKGEIHFIDSPFYIPAECYAAKERTQRYYDRVGFPEMAAYYHHHTYTEISDFNYNILYKPVKRNRYLQLLSGRDIPFPWIRIKHTEYGD